MDIKEAKDFLVQQTEEQAQIEGTPFSDLEKRMMYYAEGASATDSDSNLNDEFDVQYDNAEYEKKVGGLLPGAYARLRKEDSAGAQRWQRCIRLLAKGDHYISVLWDSAEPHERPPNHSWKLLLAGILLATVVGSAILFAEHLGFDSPLLRRIIFYPLLVIVGWFLVKHLGGKDAKS